MTSRTRSQHYTIRLSRRRCTNLKLEKKKTHTIVVVSKKSAKQVDNNSNVNNIVFFYTIHPCPMGVMDVCQVART